MLESFLVSEPTEGDRDPRQTRAPSTPGGPRLGAASVPRRFGPVNPRSHDVMHADRVSQPPYLFSPTVCLWLEGPGMRARCPSGRSRVGSNRVKSGRKTDLTFDRNLNDNKRIWSQIGPSRQIGRLKTSGAMVVLFEPRSRGRHPPATPPPDLPT